MYALLNRLLISVSIGLQLVILYVLIRKRLYRRFFWFLIYIVYAVIEAVLRLLVAGNRVLYFNVYWLTTIGSVTLAALAFRESFLNVFRAYTRLRWFVWVVWGCIGLALVYAVFKAWVFPPNPATRRGAIIVGLQLGIDYVVAVMGVLFLGLAIIFKIKDRQWESGIISGFTIYTGFEILALIGRSAFGVRFQPVGDWLPAIAYVVAEIEWAIVLSRPERKAERPRDVTLDDLTKLGQYGEFLMRILGKKS